MKRRKLLAGLIALAGAGCTTTGAAGVPSLRDAQDWASSVVAALSEFGAGAIADGSLPTQSATTVQALVRDAQAALTEFISLQPGATSGQALAEEILSALQALAPLLPLDPGTRSAVLLGISVLYAFVQDMPMTVPSVPATLQKLAGSSCRCIPA